MSAKLRGNQCNACGKTHEECAKSTCAKSEVSEYVCRMFGTRPVGKQKRS